MYGSGQPYTHDISTTAFLAGKSPTYGDIPTVCVCVCVCANPTPHASLKDEGSRKYASNRQPTTMNYSRQSITSSSRALSAQHSSHLVLDSILYILL